MAKVILNDLQNLTNKVSAVNTININNSRIEAAMEKTLSRDGTSPNEMEASLDMNSYPIYNLPKATSATEPSHTTMNVLEMARRGRQVVARKPPL